MWEARDLFVLSDLHLGPEHGTGLFQADDELAAFFDWLTDQDGPAIDVVINGDLLDFLVPLEKAEKVPLSGAMVS